MLNALERKQLETNLGLLGNALAEQAYMKIIMHGLKKLFDESGRADITERNLKDNPYEFEMTTCDSLMKLYDMNSMNTSILIDAYKKILKEDDTERAKEEDMTSRPQTNADRIRKMTVEELANNVIQGQCACCAYQLTGCAEKECKDGAYEWLMKEAEG